MAAADPRTWSLRAASAGSVALRRMIAIGIGVAGVALGIAAGLVVGRALPDATHVFPIVALGVIGLTSRLALRAWSAPPRDMRAAPIEVPRAGVLVIAGAPHDVRSCVYDGIHGVLWARGALGLPRACIEASRDVACEIVDALDRPERELRTMRAMPGAFAVPYVGFVLGFAAFAALLAGVVIGLLGPARIGVPAAIVGIPLGIFALRPATIHLGERALEWRWWSMVRAIPLASIERVEGTVEGLVVRTRDGRTHELAVRMTSSGALASFFDEAARARLRSFAAFVEKRASRSLAATFE
ncbi:hypothetical protein [Sandaracinus amylolyticus]|uniref:hypothetical protein n=1 Tax=Sandaracinus amylolyticus TaxID=927083 RepID=UPI001F3843E1|nr:hypothetical protein [Sandaracinus amylolyticus]UJR86344.1 Hypothetical protein I5071_84380 [Sandaracinus amylolyticus]